MPACLTETVPEGQFFVTCTAATGLPEEIKKKLFQQGVAGKEGLFILKMAI